MVMLHQGRILRVGSRKEFEELRDTPADRLSTAEDKLMNQFLNGFTEGPLTNAEGLSEFEKLIATG
jgi:hypothetical protein